MAGKKKAARTMNVDGVNLYELDHAGLVRFAKQVHDELTVLRDGRTLLAVERDELDASWAAAVDGATGRVGARDRRDDARRAAELGERARQERARLVCENGAAEDAARVDGEETARALAARYRGQIDQLGGAHASWSARETAAEKDGGVAPRHRDRTKRARLECAKLAKRDADRLDCQTRLVLNLADARLTDACQRDEARHEARSKGAQRDYRAGKLARTIGRYDEAIASLKRRDRDRFGKAWAPVPGLQSRLHAATVENREAVMRASKVRERNERLRAEKRAADETNGRLQRKIDETGAAAAADDEDDEDDGCGPSTAEDDAATRRLTAYKTLLEMEQCKNEILAHENAELKRAYRECRGRYDEEILCRRRRDADVAVFSSAGLFYRPPGGRVVAADDSDVATAVGFPCGNEPPEPAGTDEERSSFYGRGGVTTICCEVLGKL